MAVRAKFNVVRLSQISSDGYEIVLTPVTSGSKENESFYRWTPSDEIKLMTVNEEAVKEFEYGKPYYIDFTKAE